MAIDLRGRAWTSLLGLAAGDALGSQFFVPAHRAAFEARTLPPGPWQWTDDTEMACGIWKVLARTGRIDQDLLAAVFAEHHDFDRGYGPSTNRLLRLVREGGDWRTLASGVFDGRGSWGNGAAMRVAPLGVWFAGDLDLAAEQARLSAEVTHAHPEAVAGAIAVAVAAALAATGPGKPGPFLDRILAHVPEGTVRDGIRQARTLLTIGDPASAAAALGNGRQVAAHDTVPFCLWAAARHLDGCERDGFEAGFWATASAGGDIDTTCAIVGGILAARPGTRIPAAWLPHLEPLPSWIGPPGQRDGGMTMDELFAEPPAQWGLRGDPHAWAALRERLNAMPVPEDPARLEDLLAATFLDVVGVDPRTATGEHVYREEFAHGGMSSGHVHLPTWRDRLLPLLLARGTRH
ncbi:ADP-ribosylglycohydrolase family protein [Actinocorallia longicatena]|uniref:ADP-ribosylglycohydrolase n=1 Tax=Actinocorallia longicatena TaxID=111803 RepID=A0ABP6QDD9_9ACTN